MAEAYKARALLSLKACVVSAISFFGGAYLIRRVGEYNLSSYEGYTRGNRRRFISVCVISWLMLHLTYLIYRHLFSVLETNSSVFKEQGVRYKTSVDLRRRSARCRIAFFGFALSAHAAYFLYFVNFQLPAVLYDLCTVSLGVWIHLAFFSLAFGALAVCLEWLQAFGAGRRLVDAALAYAPLRRVAREPRVQVQLTLIASALLCLIQYLASDKLVVREATFTMREWQTRGALRLALITDLHAGASAYAPQLTAVVDAVNALDVDAILLGGDVVDAPRALIEARVLPLRQLRAKRGVFMVTGNHEYYYGNWLEWHQLFDEYAFHVLDNRVVDIGGVCLVGLSDISSNKSGIANEAIKPAVVGKCAPRQPIVVLSHNPAAAPKIVAAAETANRSVDLILSGHTHAGQYYVVAPLVYWMLPYFYGAYTLNNGATKLLVSAGTLYQAAPMKIPFASQIWVINIR